VPAQQCPGGDQEYAAPPAAQGSDDSAAVNLSPQHRVLVSKNEQLGVLAGIPAQQDLRHGQQRTSCSVQQRNDHPSSISAAEEELRTWAATSGDDFPIPTGPSQDLKDASSAPDPCG
jgi:hypothetical protein